MAENTSFRNWAAVLVLALVYLIPALFIEPLTMMDIISVPMLVFGGYGLCLLASEVWQSFKSGDQSRASLGLFGVFALLFSVVIMRPYGIATRNILGVEDWLDHTHIFPIAMYIQALGLMLFTRASAAPYVPSKGRGLAQLVAGIVIGALVASSRVLETLMVGGWKIISGWF